jgi:hypothetical protein
VELLSAILPSDEDESLLREALKTVEHMMRLAADYFFPLLLRQGANKSKISTNLIFLISHFSLEIRFKFSQEL